MPENFAKALVLSIQTFPWNTDVTTVNLPSLTHREYEISLGPLDTYQEFAVELIDNEEGSRSLGCLWSVLCSASALRK